MESLKKLKNFSSFFALLLKCTSNFQYLEKKMNLIAYTCPKL